MLISRNVDMLIRKFAGAHVQYIYIYPGWGICEFVYCEFVYMINFNIWKLNSTEL